MKDNLLEFYVNKYKFIKDGNEPDLDFIPPIMRRRMSLLDKVTLSSLNGVFSDNIQSIESPLQAMVGTDNSYIITHHGLQFADTLCY